MKIVLIILLILVTSYLWWDMTSSSPTTQSPVSTDEWGFVIKDLHAIEYPTSWDSMYISLFQENLKRVWARYSCYNLNRSQIYALTALHWMKYGPGYMKDGMLEYFIVRSNTLLTPYVTQFAFQVQFKEDRSDEGLKNWLFHPLRTFVDWTQDDSISIESDKVYAFHLGASAWYSYDLQQKKVIYDLPSGERSTLFNHYCSVLGLPCQLDPLPDSEAAYVLFLQNNNIDTV